MAIDQITRQAIGHTLHCLAGCAIGEIAGMVLGTALGWHDILTTIVSIILAFFFGYMLTASSLLRKGVPARRAVKTAVATDTVSIASMEVIDNAFIWIVPGAINAHISSPLFWASLFASLVIAFVFTVPVNRWMLRRHDTGRHAH